MAENLEELLIKVGVEVDESELVKAKKDLKELQEQGQKVAASITGKTQGTSASSSSANQSTSETQDNEQIVDILTKSQKSLFELLEIVKKGQKVGGPAQTSSSTSGGLKSGPLGLANSAVESSTGQAVGAVAGGAAGIFGGPAGIVGGAALGSTIGILLEKAFSKVSDKLAGVADQFDKRLSEDIHLRQLSFQTGQTREELYKLQAQARLAGTSLEAIVDSGQTLSDELIGGMDEKKAQVLMALHINPQDIILQSKGNPQAAQQLIYNKFIESTKEVPAAYRTSLGKILGISEVEQDARRRIYRKDYVQKGEEVYNEATKGGKVPFSTNEQLDKDILDFRGQILKFEGALRAALTGADLAKNLSVGLLKVQTALVEVVTGGIINISGGNVNNTAPQTSAQKERDIRQFNSDRAFDKPIEKKVDYGIYSGFGSDRALNNNSQNAKAAGGN